MNLNAPVIIIRSSLTIDAVYLFMRNQKTAITITRRILHVASLQIHVAVAKKDQMLTDSYGGRQHESVGILTMNRKATKPITCKRFTQDFIWNVIGARSPNTLMVIVPTVGSLFPSTTFTRDLVNGKKSRRLTGDVE